MRHSQSALISATDLQQQLGVTKVLDASWYIPPASRDPDQEFQLGHIPGAARFDIDSVADPSSTLPHMLPSPEAFAAHLARLGIAATDPVCVYDASTAFTAAARGWWMFRALGHTGPVHVLDGGLVAWRGAGLEVTTDHSLPAESVTTGCPWSKVDRLVLDYAQVVSPERTLPMVDARPMLRFSGESKDPRGLRSGHMPGSLNVPHTELVAADGRMKTAEELRKVFATRGVPTDGQVAGVTCGSGVTAAVVMLAMFEAGWREVGLYDGSWVEYASRPESIVQPGV